ncbi:hypothetical protein K491DRAFT_175281 [Lophiostoma macrostomum CBS 122681]|uniref:Rhodopsin domain-containing protein n=1 Tax=Lophiostoma macrostomum CBS 122681 TaxID=1314788 RepID=A0A6A6TQK7_9PLEO|nr:hypothetical protein K491DRAFT_175281 [Lophiostoma macrostomum CBS 122681]
MLYWGFHSHIEKRLRITISNHFEVAEYRTFVARFSNAGRLISFTSATNAQVSLLSLGPSYQHLGRSYMGNMDEFEGLDHFINQATAASWPFFAVATIVFGMRVTSRAFFTEASAGWEDAIIAISWMLDAVRMITFQLALDATRKLDPSNLPATVPRATFWSLFTDAWSFLSVTLPKVGVAILLVRIFRPRAWVHATILSAAIGVFVFCSVGFIICFVKCNPVPGQWDPYKYPHTKCWPQNVQIDYTLVGSSCSAFLDLAFALYPGFVIWRLNMPKWQKLSTMGFMGLGVAAFAVAVVKVTSITTLLGKPTLNQLYTGALHTALWNSIENDLIITAACLPSIRPLLRIFWSFTRTHLTVSKATRVNSASDSQHSLTTRKNHATMDENTVELAMGKGSPSFPNWSIHVDQSFQVNYEHPPSSR